MAFGDIKGTLSGAANSVGTSLPITTGGPITVAVGDLIYAVIAEQTTITSTACNDNLGNTYTAVSSGVDAGATVTGRSFYSIVSVAGSLSTVTFTANGGANNAVGLATVVAGMFARLDANPTEIINDNTTPFTCPATGTLAGPQEVVMCFAAQTGSVTLTATSPNVKAIQLNTQTVLTAAIGQQLVAATTSVAPAWTSSGTPTESVYGTASFRAYSGAIADLHWNPSTSVATVDTNLGKTLGAGWVVHIVGAPLGWSPNSHSETTFDVTPISSTISSFAYRGVVYAPDSYAGGGATWAVTATAGGPQVIFPQFLIDNDALFAPAVVLGAPPQTSYAFSSPLYRYRQITISEAITPPVSRVIAGALSPVRLNDSDSFFTPAVVGGIISSVSYASASPLYRYRRAPYSDVTVVISPAKIQFLAPGLISDTDSFFSSGIALFVSPLLISDSDVFSAPSVAASYQLLPGQIIDSDSIPTLGVAATASIQPAIITDADTIYSVTVTTVGEILPQIISDSDSFLVPIVFGAPVQPLTPSLLSDADTFLTPAVSAPATTQALTPAVLSDADTLFTPTVRIPFSAYAGASPLIIHSRFIPPISVTEVVTRVTIGPVLFVDADVFFAPTVVGGVLTTSVSYGAAEPLIIHSRFIPPMSVTVAFSLPGISTVPIIDTDTIFSPAVAVGLVPSLFIDADNFFAPTVPIGPLRIVDSDTFFTASLTTTVSASIGFFIDSDGFFGPSVGRGAVSISPSPLVDSDTVYAPNVAQAPLQALSPNRIDDTDNLYVPIVGAGTVGVSPILFTDNDAFFAPLLTLSVSPGLFTDTDTVFGPTLLSTVSLTPNQFTDTDNFFTPSTVSGTVNVSPALFTDTDTVFVPSIAGGGAQAIVPDLTVDADSLSAPTVTAGAVNVSPSLFTSADAFFAPVLTASASLSPSLFVDVDNLFSPALSVGLIPNRLVDSDFFFSPASIGASLTPGSFTDTDAFFAPTVRLGQDISPVEFTDVDVFFAPVIGVGAVNLSPNRIVDADTFFMPATLAGNIVPAKFTDSDTFFSPTVLSGGITPALFIDVDHFLPPQLTYAQSASAQSFADQDFLFMPTILTTFKPPEYEYPIEHSLDSDYGIRRSKLRRGRYVIGRR